MNIYSIPFCIFMFLSTFLLSSCAHNNIVDVKLENNDQVSSRKFVVDKKIVIVINNEFSNYIYEHHDLNWTKTFRIHVGQYTALKINKEIGSIFNSKINNSLQDVTQKNIDYILIPEFGSISYFTPGTHAFQDAQFSAEIKIRILDGSKKEIETIHSKASSVGTFGRGGSNTDELAKDTINKTIKEITEKLVGIIQ